jgi:hypothetical protein
MKLYYVAILALGIAVSAGGLVQAEETTRVYRQGNSSATITQSGGGSTMTRRTVHGPDSQTIILRQDGNSAVVTQSSRGSIAHSSQSLDRDMSEDVVDDSSHVQITVSMTPEEQEALLELARDEDTTVQALIEEAIQEFLDRY